MDTKADNSSSVDSDLLTRAIAGEPLAVERLLLGYQGRLLTRISRKLPAALQGSVTAEDVLQDTFLEICRRIRGFQPRGANAFARWLVTIADGKLIDAIRERQAAKRGGSWLALDPQAGGSSAAPLLELLWADSHTASRSVARHDIESAVGEAVSGLKPEYREAVRLRFLEGLSVSEVAARMDRTEWSVHKLCSRGLKQLREVMGDPARFFSRG